MNLKFFVINKIENQYSLNKSYNERIFFLVLTLSSIVIILLTIHNLINDYNPRLVDKNSIVLFHKKGLNISELTK